MTSWFMNEIDGGFQSLNVNICMQLQLQISFILKEVACEFQNGKHAFYFDMF